MNNSLEIKRKLNYSLKNKNRTIIGYKGIHLELFQKIIDLIKNMLL